MIRENIKIEEESKEEYIKLTKNVIVINPLQIVTGKPLEKTHPMIIIPVEVQNTTDNINYFDSSFGSIINPSEIKGMNVVIEDLECDLSKSIVQDLSKSIENSYTMNLLKLKANKLFYLELIHGVNIYLTSIATITFHFTSR